MHIIWRFRLLISGNPGLASYYEDFMLSLKPKLPDEYSIWTLGHGGHDIPENAENFPSFSDHAELFNLESTIQQKVDFVKTHISSDQEVILIGHSIGAKMVIEVMKSKIANVKIGKISERMSCLKQEIFSSINFGSTGKSFLEELLASTNPQYD